MAEVKYIVLKQPLNIRTATTGTMEICPPDMTTAYQLWNSLAFQGVMSGNPEWYVLHGAHAGKIKDWGHELAADELYTFCPDITGGLEIPLGILIAGLVLGAASVGYSIYSYMDMKNMVGDLTNQDPTLGDGAASQSYSYATKENWRTDNLPIPIVYGKTKVGGVVINELQYGPHEGESESYKVLLALAEGPVTGIAGSSDIMLNDSLLTEYTNYDWGQLTGTPSQTASTMFSELYQQHFPMNRLQSDMCLYFPMTYSSSTVVGVGTRNCGEHRELDAASTLADPSTVSDNYTPTYSAQSNVSISTSVTPGTSVSTASLRISSTAGYLRYAEDFQHFFEPGGDPFNIEWRMYYSAADRAAMSTGNRYIMFHRCGDTAASNGREWRVNFHTSKTTAFDMRFIVEEHQPDSQRMHIRSLIQRSTVYDDGWHHYRVCRDGDYARWFMDGVDITDLSSNTVIRDDADVYARNGTNHFYFGGVALNSMRCYLSDVRMDIGGNVAYNAFDVSTAGHKSSSEGYVRSQSRGYADKVMWQYKWPGGMFNSGSSGQSYKREGSLFEEVIETSGADIFCHDNGISGVGGSIMTTPRTRLVTARNNASLIRQQEMPFDYISLVSFSGGANWRYGENITGVTSGHVGELVGYRYIDATHTRLYLRNPTGTFTTGESVNQPSGSSGVIGSDAALQTDTTYESFYSRKVSPGWNNTYRKSVCELKSITEVRGFRDVTALTGVPLIYPHTAMAAVDIRAQKGLTSIPKVNAIMTGFGAKTLYRWDSTNEIPSSIGAKNLYNPAWACWDLMTDGFWNNGTAYARGYNSGAYEGYGIGIHPKYLDYASFAEWSSYCTATVNGEVRCKVNISIDEKDKTLWDAVESIAIVGRGRLVPMGLKWYAKINEKVTAPAIPVGGSLIETGSYEEDYVDDPEKYDELNIKFLNENNKYIEDVVGDASEEWDDPAEYDIFKTKTVFVKGITGSGQAKREAILRRQQVQSLNKRVRFVMDIDAINFEVGDVIQVQHDSNKYSFSYVCNGSGQQSASIYFIKLSPGGSGDFTVVLPSQTYGSEGKIAWRNNADDTWDEKTIQGPFDTETNVVYMSSSPTITAGDPVFIGRASTATYSDFDLIRVEEMNLHGTLKAEIIGYNYDPDVYTHTDYGTTAI